jgi:hypothetical protein
MGPWVAHGSLPGPGARVPGPSLVLLLGLEVPSLASAYSIITPAANKHPTLATSCKHIRDTGMGGGGLEWDQKDNNNKHSHRFAILQYMRGWHICGTYAIYGLLMGPWFHRAAMNTKPQRLSSQRRCSNNGNTSSSTTLTQSLPTMWNAHTHTHPEAVGPKVFSFYFLFSLFTSYSLYFL